MKIRPKGSDKPFQPVHDIQEGMYGIKWKLRTGTEYTAWYEKEELEVQE